MARKSKVDIGKKKDAKAKTKKKSEKDVSALEQSFAAAIKAVESSPDSEDSWDHLEELADDLQRPDEVAELYRKVLDKRMPKDLKETLSQRAVDFHEEWFGDNPDAMSGLFLRIIDIDPSAEWAFERLTLVLTLSKQWEQLLEVYDRMLGITQEPSRRRRLLDDAAHVAKDFADKPDLAVDYLKQILALEPQNKTLIASIERLLERLSRWQELIDLWRRQIPNLRADEARLVRVRIATCYLEKVEDFGKTLEELRTLLGVSPGYPEGMELAERILRSEKAPADVRRGALDLLRTNYETAGQPGDVVRVIELGLEFADGREWIALHREAGNRLAELNRDEDAIEH
jgi:tetratricopeptide (TPR) repeat protein